MTGLASPGDLPARVLLEGTSLTLPPGLRPGAESIGIPCALRMGLDFLGDDLGLQPTGAEDQAARTDALYAFLMGTSGEAFRFWETLYHYDRAADVERVLRGPLEAAGCAYELVLPEEYAQRIGFQGRCHTDDASRRQLLMEQLAVQAQPTVCLEAGAWPDWRLIVGYDRQGEVLLGYGVEGTNYPPGSAQNPLREFTVADMPRAWLVLIGAKQAQPPLSESYLKGLAYALDLLRLESAGGRAEGQEAYAEWARGLEDDAAFPADDPETLQSRYHDFLVTSAELAERRWYGVKFLEQAAQYCAADEELLAARASLEAVHSLVREMWDLTGGPQAAEAHLLLAKRAVREQIAARVRQAAAHEADAADHLEGALASLQER